MLSFFTGFAHQAVIVFFVLSGWLVGGSLLNKRHQSGIIADYAIDRVTRLWIVLVPALLLSIALGLASGSLASGQLDLTSNSAYSATSFVGNLLGLQGIAVPRFGDNFPLWSLANETWYYILFPLIVLAFSAERMARRMVAAVLVLAIAVLLTPEMMLYFGLWLMGVGFSRVRITASNAWIAAQTVLFLAIATWGRLAGHNGVPLAQSLFQDTAFALAFLPLLCSLQRKADLSRPGVALLAAAGERLSAFSFTLYVVHVPLLLYLASVSGGVRLSPDDPMSLLAYTALLAVLVVTAWLLYLPFEAQTYRLRRAVKSWLRPAVRARAA